MGGAAGQPRLPEGELASVGVQRQVSTVGQVVLLHEGPTAALGAEARVFQRDQDRYCVAVVHRDQVHVDKESKSLIAGTVKEYSVVIDIARERIEHDCVDFRTNRARGKLLCKHLGAFLLRIDTKTAMSLLRRLLHERDRWTFE